MEFNSDKFYWHRYTEEYERVCFSTIYQPNWIMEIGVLRGESVRFLSNRFPSATIIGVDRDQQEGEWPTGEKIKYVRLDQEKKEEIVKMFREAQFDLVIDDGSHLPEHQATTLVASVGNVNNLIIEDIHTNLEVEGSPLQLLLTIEHLKNRGKDLSVVKKLAGKYFTEEEAIRVANSVKSIHMYRRALLPLKCWNCKGDDFDYVRLVCSCTQKLYETNDSMAAIIKF